MNSHASQQRTFFRIPQMKAVSILTVAVYYLVKIILLYKDYCNIITVKSRIAMTR